MKKIDVPLGSTVRDKITGFEGFAFARLEYMNNCVRFEVQPPVKDGDLPESKVFDGLDLEVMSPPKDGLPPVIKTPNNIRLGAKVKDVLTGLTGVAVVRLKNMHSGDRYGVQVPVNGKGEVPKLSIFDEEDLVQIDPPVKKKKESLPKPPNGPHGHGLAVER
ncbi:MAG: hypothetical protein Q7S70_02640 [bacterium]|nr:hypothetical protein [bacterium]